MIIVDETNKINAMYVKVHEFNIDINFYMQFKLDIEDLYVWGVDIQVGLTS